VISKSVRSGALVSLVRETIEGRVLLAGTVWGDRAEAEPRLVPSFGTSGAGAELPGDVRLRVVA
jgi:hypothetical protein